MNSKEVLKATMQLNRRIINGYLDDLSDADFLVRPVPEANHIAWQLGHLIASECHFLGLLGGTPPELPAGFAKSHAKDTATHDQGFATKAEYLGLLKQVREATAATLEKTAEADLDKPITGDMAKMAPTVGRLFVLLANHELMHAGQFAVVRRKLGKPVLF